MKRKALRRVTILVVALALVFVFATTALAGSASFVNKHVYGGASQTQSLGSKDRVNIRYYCSYINWLGETLFRYRGYDEADNTACSVITEIKYEGVYYYANYTADPSSVRVKASIATTDTSQYLTYNGQLRF